VYAASDGIFLRVFTPEEPHGRQDGINTMPDFPAGDISFLLVVSSPSANMVHRASRELSASRKETKDYG